MHRRLISYIPLNAKVNLKLTPASYAQRRFILDELYRFSASSYFAYNIPRIFKGHVHEDDVEIVLKRLELSILHLIERHEALRTLFFIEDACFLSQIVIPLDKVTFRIETVKGCDEDVIDFLLLAASNFKFDTTLDEPTIERPRKPLVRVFAVHRKDEQTLYLSLVFHHSVTDLTSLNIFFRELSAVFHSYCELSSTPLLQGNLSSCRIQYSEFSRYEHQKLSGSLYLETLNWWFDHLDHCKNQVLNLPLDRPRDQSDIITSGKSVIVKFSIATSEIILKYIQQLKQAHVTLNRLFHVSLAIFLSKIAQEDTVNLSLLNANRYMPRSDDIIGPFVNNNPCSITCLKSMSYSSTLLLHAPIMKEMMQHSFVPFEEIINFLKPQRTLNVSPLTQVAQISYPRNFMNLCLELNGHTLQMLDTERQALFDLSFTQSVTENVICSKIQYFSTLFDHFTIEKLSKRWNYFIEQMLNDRNMPISAINLTLPEELQLYEQVNQTSIEFGSPMCVHELILAHASKYPDKEAVVLDDQSLTYSQLVDRAMTLAKAMHAKGVRLGDVVVQCVERSIEMIIGMVAIQLLGAVYCPVHPEDPEDRIAYVVKNVNAKCILTMDVYKELVQLVSIDAKILVMFFNQADDLTSDWLLDVHKTRELRSPAYIITTSGSTGKPKSLQIPPLCSV
jgi:hypothetical protein